MLRRSHSTLFHVTGAALHDSIGNFTGHLFDQQTQVAAGAIVRGSDVTDTVSGPD